MQGLAHLWDQRGGVTGVSESQSLTAWGRLRVRSAPRDQMAAHCPGTQVHSQNVSSPSTDGLEPTAPEVVMAPSAWLLAMCTFTRKHVNEYVHTHLGSQTQTCVHTQRSMHADTPPGTYTHARAHRHPAHLSSEAQLIMKDPDTSPPITGTY